MTLPFVIMDDIEDLIAVADDVRTASAVPAQIITTKPSRRRTRKPTTQTQTAMGGATKCSLDTEAKRGVPGTEKIWVKTFGCSHNVSDSEYMSGTLHSYGYDVVVKEEQKTDADLWLINSCTVKNPSESAFLNLVEKGKVGSSSPFVWWRAV